MIYSYNTHLTGGITHVDYIMQDPYVYYLIRTKSTYNLCADSYISIVRYSFSQICISYEVSIQKIGNGLVINVSLESEQFFNVAFINLTTHLMIDRFQYQMVSSGRYPTSTSKDTGNLSSKSIFYVDRWGSKC